MSPKWTRHPFTFLPSSTVLESAVGRSMQMHGWSLPVDGYLHSTCLCNRSVYVWGSRLVSAGRQVSWWVSFQTPEWPWRSGSITLEAHSKEKKEWSVVGTLVRICCCCAINCPFNYVVWFKQSIISLMLCRWNPSLGLLTRIIMKSRLPVDCFQDHSSFLLTWKLEWFGKILFV